MDESKGILTRLGEAIDQYHADWGKRRAQAASNTLPVTPHKANRLFRLIRWFVPNGGTLLIVLLLIATQSLWSAPLRAPSATSTSTISYQGRLADAGGNPLSNNYNMEFRIYDVPDGGTPLWQEYWTGSNSVEVNDGLFNVMLGSIDTTLAGAIAGHNELYLGITVGTDGEMSPRVQLGSVPFSMQALTVADGSVTMDKIEDGAVTNSKLALQGSLNLGESQSSDAWLRGGYGNLGINNSAGSLRNLASNSIYFFIDSDNDATDQSFRVLADSTHLGGEVREVFSVYETADAHIRGTLDMHGNAIINQGAMVEANLQTPAELSAEKIERFSEGDVLCWGEDRLEHCTQAGSRLVQAVADENGKPIVIGAEVIKVLGAVRRGDLLVASGVEGYAMVDNTPPPGSVIAQALEAFDGKKGLVKAMIRKW